MSHAAAITTTSADETISNPAPFVESINPVNDAYVLNGAAHLAHELQSRWDIDAKSAFAELMSVLATVAPGGAGQSFRHINEVLCPELDRYIVRCGHRATHHELTDLHTQFWLMAERWVQPSTRAELRETFGYWHASRR
jgi:hypothetical protein